MTRPLRPATALVATLLTTAFVFLAGVSPAAAADATPFSLRPFVECVWNNNNGTVTVSLGYESSNAGTVTVPVGSNNNITPGAQNQGQPTTFAPGRHTNVWAFTMPLLNYFFGQWHLMSANMNMTMNGTACASKPVSMTAGNGLVYLGTSGLLTLAGVYALARRRRRPRFATLDAV
jgi:hypothetical protein